MKITETVTRDCCHSQKDFQRYSGTPIPGFTPEYAKRVQLSFCVHCGQLWWHIRRPGEMDAGWERVTPDDMGTQKVVEQCRNNLQMWCDKQSHDRCWYYPDIFRVLCRLLGVVASADPKLPSRCEFEVGCKRYTEEQYDEPQRIPLG